MEGIEAFSYSPLPDGNHIRLATIKPGLANEPIRLLLEDTLIADAARYTALSYTWGHLKATKSITCDSRQFEVTPNLHEALLGLRRPAISRTVWVDAICINQEDVAERSAQVRMMGLIYAKATQVVIWLGEEENGTVVAFKLLKHFANDHLPSRKVKCPQVADAELAAIKRVFQRPWFERTWVFQEVVLARNAHMWCGSQSLSWTDCCKACNWLRHSELRGAIGYEIRSVLSIYGAQLRLIENHSRDDGGLRLTKLLDTRRFSISTDPRDKVYGLLGIATHTGSLVPDYAKTIAEVFMETAKALIVEDQHLEILSSVQYTERKPNVPSWAPDWSKTEAFYRLGCRTVGDDSVFCASPGTKPVMIIDNDLTQLKIHGLQVDCIATAHDARQGLDIYGASGWLTLFQFHSIVEAVGLHGKYPFTDELYEHAYATTVFGGLAPFSTHARKEKTPYKSEYIATYFDFTIRYLRDKVPRQGSTSVPSYADYLESLQHTKDRSLEQVTGTLEWNSLRELAWHIGRMTLNRRFFITQKGYIGLGPQEVRPGDTVSLLFGGDVLYVIRAKGDHHELLGDCYVHGLMNGEAMKADDGSLREPETIVLV